MSEQNNGMDRRGFLRRAGVGVAVGAAWGAGLGSAQAALRRAVVQGEIQVDGGRVRLWPARGVASARGWHLEGLAHPVAAAVDGVVTYVCDALADEVLVVDAHGDVRRWTGAVRPSGVAVVGDRVHVSAAFDHDVVVFDRRGRVVHRYGDLNAPRGLAADGDRVWVADSGNARVVAFREGRLVAQRALPGVVPRDVMVDGAGGLHVASAIPPEVRHLAADGRVLERWSPAGLPRAVSRRKDTVVVGVA